MFDITKAVQQNEYFKYAKVWGLPYNPRPINPPVKHISEEDIDTIAIRESVFIKRRFTSSTRDFGKRLRKHSGQDHKRKGYYKPGIGG